MMKGVHFTFTATNKAAPAMKSFENGLRSVRNQTVAAERTNTSFMRGMSDNRRAIQNAGYQVGDFAVQLAGGQNAMLAFSQQGGQMLQFFGAFGAVAGAALAIAAAVALSMGAMSTKTVTVSGAMADVSESFRKYIQYAETAAAKTADLVKQFGIFADDVRGFSKYMTGVQLANAFDTLREALDPVKGQLVDVQTAMTNVTRARDALTKAEADGANPSQIMVYKEALAQIQDQFDNSAAALGLNADQALRLGNAIDRIGANSTISEMTFAARDAMQVITEMVDRGYELPKPLRETAAALEEMVRLGAEAGVAVDNMTFGFDDALVAANGVVTATKNIGLAAEGTLSAIKKMAGALWDAAMARGAATRRLDEMSREFSAGGQAELKYGGRGAPNSAQTALGRQYDMFGNPITGSSAGSAASGGGGGTDALASLRERLALETQLLGMTEAQKQVVQALGPEWQSYGDVVINGLVAQISAIDQFNQRVAEQQSIANTIKSSMENAFMGIVSGTMKAKDAFRAMASSIISELFKVLVVQKLVGSFNAATGVGSGLMGLIGGGLKSFDGGGYTGYGARAGGMDGKGGFPAMLHPGETVVDHTKGGTGGVTVNQNISFGSGVTKAEVQSMLPKIVEASKRAVLDAKQRGGRYGQAMA